MVKDQCFLAVQGEARSRFHADPAAQRWRERKDASS